MKNTIIFYACLLSATVLSACGGGSDSGGTQTPVTNYRVDTVSSAGGSISPSAVTVNENESVDFTLTADNGFSIASVSGCSGTLNGDTYTTAAINNNCTVTVSFIDSDITQWTVSANAGIGGSISPATVLVADGGTVQLTLTPDDGFVIDSVTGCNGTLNGSIYTSSAINENCTINASFLALQPPVVDAGDDQTVDELTTVTLSGAATDSDGTVVSYVWRQTAGNPVTLNNNTSATASFSAPDAVNVETLRFQLQVTDNDGQIGIDEIIITVNPVASNTVSVVAATGMPAVGFPDGYIYWSVFEPVIGDAGHIAFLGAADTSIGQTQQNTKTLWAGLPNDLNVIVQENDSLPDLPGNVLYGGNTTSSSNIPALIVSSSGSVAHYTSLKGSVNDSNNRVLLVHKDNILHNVMRAGDQADGFAIGNTYGSLIHYAFSDAGLVFSAEVRNTAGQASYGVWYWDFDEIRLLALTDLSRDSALHDLPQESPNIDGGNCHFAAITLQSLQINDQGTIAFNTAFSGNDCSYQFPLLKWDNGSFTSIVAHEQPVIGLTDYRFSRFTSAFESFILYANGDIGLHSTISNGAGDLRSLFWVSEDAGDQQYLALGGEILPGSSSETMINNLGLLGLPPVTDGQGSYVITTLNSADPSEVHVLEGAVQALPYNDITEIGASSLNTLVKTGDVPPDYPSTAFFSSISRSASMTPSVNIRGEIVFFASRSDALDSGVNVPGLWYINSNGEIQKLLEVGDSIPVAGANSGVTHVLLSSLGLALAGGSSAHSNTGELFVMGRLNNAFQALFFITP